MADIEVKMGEYWVTNQSDVLTASGVGSCLVIALYDPWGKIGGMAHAMLPMASKGKAAEGHSEKGKYVDLAIEEMLKEMAGLGAHRDELEAKIVGGGNMFPNLNSDIGSENILRAKKKLKEEEIFLVGESVGGGIGRSVEFSAASGIVSVKVRF